MRIKSHEKQKLWGSFAFFGIFFLLKNCLIFTILEHSLTAILKNDKMLFENGQKIIVHKLNILRSRILEKLHTVDTIPTCIRQPLGVVIVIIGAILFCIPIINWTIVMIIGARMITKSFFYKIWNLVIVEKKYKSPRAALLDTLKR